MTDTFFLFATITPKTKHWNDAKTALCGIVVETIKEPGCIQFILHEKEEDGNLYLYEEWTNQEALDEHYRKPYTLSVFENYQSWLAKPVDIKKFYKLAP